MIKVCFLFKNWRCGVLQSTKHSGAGRWEGRLGQPSGQLQPFASPLGRAKTTNYIIPLHILTNAKTFKKYPKSQDDPAIKIYCPWPLKYAKLRLNWIFWAENSLKERLCVGEASPFLPWQLTLRADCFVVYKKLTDYSWIARFPGDIGHNWPHRTDLEAFTQLLH